MGKRSKEAMKKAKEAEAQKMKDQQNGVFEKCHRPTLTGVINGEVGDCKIKPFTQRRCPPCSSHRKTVAFSLAGKQRAARAQIELNIIKLNARQLLKDKETLLQTNSELSEEMRKTKIAYHNSIQQNITTSKALEEWKLSHNQLQAGIQTLQNNILQLESLIKNLQHRDATISYYFNQQTREAAEICVTGILPSVAADEFKARLSRGLQGAASDCRDQSQNFREAERHQFASTA